MAKIHTTLSVDSELLKDAKDKGFNISAELERFLKGRVAPTKQDLPSHSLMIICSFCGSKCNHCFYCRERQKVYCQNCNDEWVANGVRDDCPRAKDGSHEHIRVPGYEGQNADLKGEIMDAQTQN